MALTEGIGDEDRALYLRILTEIRWRTEHARRHIMASWDVANVELVALHVRKISELIVFGSLVANRGAVEKVASAFAKRDADGARKIAKNVNPEYWPRPLTGPDDAPLLVADGFLREEDWGRAYGLASDVLHTSNPYAPVPDYGKAAGALKTVMDQIVTLLDRHQVMLLDRDYMLICTMKAGGAGPQVAKFRRVANP